MDETDIRLMEQIKADDMSSFSELLDRHQPRVFSFIHKFLGNTSVAEDLAQETFIRVYKARKTYRPTARFTTWLFQIVKNLCLNHMKKDSRGGYSIDSSDPESNRYEHLSGPDGGPVEEVKNKEIAQAVQSAIHSLPPNQKMAMILSRYENLPYKEIAERLGISAKAVKSLLARARDNVKIKLQPYISIDE